MSVSISIIPPPGFPDPREPIIFFSRSPGNIMTAPEVLGMPPLDDIAGKDHAAMALTQVIAELDKGDAGKLSDRWCVDADARWSGGREMEEAWGDVSRVFELRKQRQEIPSWLRSRNDYWGHVTRERLRTTAMRFLLYYAAGYEVRWGP